MFRDWFKRLLSGQPHFAIGGWDDVGKITSRLIHTEEEKFVTEKATGGMGDE